MIQGPVLGWLNTVEAFQKTKTPIPLNLKVGSRRCCREKILRNHVLQAVVKKASQL